jgi:hypothetical protein
MLMSVLYVYVKEFDSVAVRLSVISEADQENGV